MRIALAQINPTIGDFAGNSQKIVRAALEARARGAVLSVFPELCLCGYPPRDLLEKTAFLDAQDQALDKLKLALRGLPAIVGYVARRQGDVGNLRYNAAALLIDGEIRAEGRKCLLPNYDVFDEARYFEPSDQPTVVDVDGIKLGLSVCEDAWNDKDFWSRRMYRVDPMEKLVHAGADVLINISASPYALGKLTTKEAMLSSLARKYHLPLVYCNQVGGNDDLIFDGRSMVFDEKGKLIARAAAFEECVSIVDLQRGDGTVEDRLSEEEELRRGLVLGIRDYAGKCGFKGGVLGLSGGIDSALVAALAVQALGPENVIGVAMPSRYNAESSLEDARDLAERLGCEFHVISIEKAFGAFRETLAPVFAGRPEDTTEENLQARIRGVLLMALSNKFGHLLLTTGNKSELAVGYCTLYGDMCGGLAAINDLYKTTVYRLSSYLNERARLRYEKQPIPLRSIEKAPSAELRPNQTDQDSLPPYDTLDGILKAYIEELKSSEQIVALGYDAPTVQRVLRLVDGNEYKRRQAPPGLKVTGKAFGIGRRMPIAQRFKPGS